jgi:AbiV family abortive infection protein
MKTRQFKKLAGLSPARRASLVVEGLVGIGDNVGRLVEELEKCNAAGAYRSARLLRNVGREEAGKFLVLIDAWRALDADAKTISRQFARAGAHLSKLIYAQIADYSIASQSELVDAVNRHRQGSYLDGPNDHDWIFRNDLLSERPRERGRSCSSARGMGGVRPARGFALPGMDRADSACAPSVPRQEREGRPLDLCRLLRR